MLGRRPTTPLEKSLGYRFRRLELLEEALTHRSRANEQDLAFNYERLEFLGDAILGVMAAEWLFSEHPDLSEGELSKLKSALVSEKVLAEHARDLGIGEALRLGVGEDRSGGRGKASLLADAMEAILGALWLDGGPEPARKVVRGLLTGAIEARDRIRQGDAKTRLQERVQAWGWARPGYRVVDEEGPDHRKRFTVECRVNGSGMEGEVVARGEGRSKKEAQQAAASRVLEELASRVPEGGADGKDAAAPR